MELMLKPVTLSDGHDYEEDQVRRWLNKGNRLSPLTGETLPSLFLKPNVELRSRIVAWTQAREARKAPRAVPHASALAPVPVPMPVPMPMPMPVPVPVPVQAVYVPPAPRRGAAASESK